MRGILQPSRFVIRLVVVAGVTLGAASASLAQNYGSRGTTDSLDRTLRNGRLLGVPAQGAQGQPSYSSQAGGVLTPRGTSMAASAYSPSGAYGGRSGSRPTFGGTMGMIGNRTALLMPLGSSFARPFAGSGFTGYTRLTPPLYPTYDETAGGAIQENFKLLWNYSYHHRLYQQFEGIPIRDELTTESLTNAPGDEGVDYDAPRKSHADRVYEELSARRKEYLRDAWRSLGSREYFRAISLFDNVIMIAPDDLEANVGRFISAVVDGQNTTAQAFLTQLTRRREDMFTAQYSLQDVLFDQAIVDSAIRDNQDDITANDKDVEAVRTRQQERAKALVELTLNSLSRLADAGDSDYYPALNVYMLWLDGRRSAALAEAEALQKAFPSSVFAVFPERMRRVTNPETYDGPNELPELRALSRVPGR